MTTQNTETTAPAGQNSGMEYHYGYNVFLNRESIKADRETWPERRAEMVRERESGKGMIAKAKGAK